MLKAIGVLLIIGTTTLVGFQLSNQFAKRVKELRQFILSLQMIEAEMSYSQLNLQTIFKNIGDKLEYPISQFYKNMFSEMDTTITSFTAIWENQLDIMIHTISLKTIDLNIMKQFGRNLGRHTFTQQQKHITLTIKHLEKQQEEAIEQQKRYGNMTKTLGFLIGLVIVILFF